MRVSKAFWIWGQFSESDTLYLNQLKDKIQKNLQSPIFDVHITLTGPYLEIDNCLIDKLKVYCEKNSPIQINLKNFQFKKEFYKSFYLSVKHSQKLLNLRKEICLLNNFKSNKNYEPHISLAYGNYTQDKKINLIKKLPKIKDKIKIEKISLVDVNEDLNHWKVLKSFKLT